MTYVTMPAGQAATLYHHASIIAETLVAMQTLDADLMPLDLGTDQALEETIAERNVHLQAIDEFMAERVGFKARIAHLEGIQASQSRALTTLLDATATPPTVSILGAENAKLRSDVKALEDATIQAAGFIDSLRASLKRLGVTFDTDELGMPRISVNADELASWAYETRQAERLTAWHATH